MFSKKERDYLKGEIKPNKNYEKMLRKRINRKIRSFLNEDLPTLSQSHFVNRLQDELMNRLEIRGTENSTLGIEFSTPNQSMRNQMISIDRNNEREMRSTGFEPVFSAWRADVLDQAGRRPP